MRVDRARMRPALLAVLLMITFACTLRPLDRCFRNSDCLPGRSCQEGRCVGTGAGDARGGPEPPIDGSGNYFGPDGGPDSPPVDVGAGGGPTATEGGDGSEEPSALGGGGGLSSLGWAREDFHVNHGPGQIYACGSDPVPSTALCPRQAPDEGTGCAGQHNAICDYQGARGWTSCTCVSGRAGDVWKCATTTNEFDYDCPTGQPKDRTACNIEEAARVCPYLRPLGCTCPADRPAPFRRDVRCTCDSASLTWSCVNDSALLPGLLTSANDPTEVRSNPGVCFGPRTALPKRPNLDEAMPLATLTVSEVRSWCEWFFGVNREGNVPLGSGTFFCYDPVPVCYTDVSIDGCVRALGDHDCAAPVRALDDCLLTFHDECGLVGDGCGPLFQAGCHQTLFGVPDGDTCPSPQ
jgi:hypothetical protein